MPRGEPASDGVRLALQVVPGASRSEVVGRHGDRIRVRVAAPAEGGKANREVCALLAARLGLPRRAVTIVAGASSPRKTAEVAGLTPADVEARLAL